jgi:MFS family permease
VGTLAYTAGGLSVLFFWLLWGDLAWQLRERSAIPIVSVMLQRFQASDVTTGLFVVSIPAAATLLLAPVVSYRSDRHRGRLGRRIPYLFLTTPAAAAALIALSLSPGAGAWIHAHLGSAASSPNLSIILTMGAFWALFEMATVTSNLVFGALINDVVPRELIGRFYGLFRAVSLIVGMLFNLTLIGHAKEHFRPILMTIGVVYGLGFLVMCLRVREGTYPPPAETAPGARSPLHAARNYLRVCFSHPYYLLVFVWLAVSTASYVPVDLYAIFASQSFGLSLTSFGRYRFAIYACSFAMAYPLGWLADRVHAVRIGLATQIVYAALTASAFFTVGPHNYGGFYLVHGVIAGCYLTGTAAIGQMLFPKLRYAQLASGILLTTSIVNVLLGPSVGSFLDHVGRNYRYTFAIGSLMALASVALGFAVHKRFMRLGGPSGYVAPE